MSVFDLDVAIVGSGPAGIAVATALTQAGIENVVIFERETKIGGTPRHTHHPTFGLLVFKRPMSGPNFLQAIIRRCPKVKFETQTTVVALRPGGELVLVTPSGSRTVRARHIVLATGAREAPRHARLISGLRPQGVLTTGALQQFIYEAKLLPFRRPVIVGTELVGFSALWTLRSAGAVPVAVIEENTRVTAYRPAVAFARFMGAPILYGSRIVDIGGLQTISHVTVETAAGEQRRIDCDGVIFSGKFVGENALVQISHLGHCPTTGLPTVDQHWSCTDPAVSAVGNMVHPADMGDRCYFEGLHAGRVIAAKLAGGPTAWRAPIAVTHDPRIKMTTPSCVSLAADETARFDISIQVVEHFFGRVTVTFEGKVVYRRLHRCMPARRIKLRNISLNQCGSGPDSIVQVALGA